MLRENFIPRSPRLGNIQTRNLRTNHICLITFHFAVNYEKPANRHNNNRTQNLRWTRRHSGSVLAISIPAVLSAARGQLVRQGSYGIIRITRFGYVFQIQAVCLAVCMLTVLTENTYHQSLRTRKMLNLDRLQMSTCFKPEVSF
jgi:hypothetical protein